MYSREREDGRGEVKKKKKKSSSCKKSPSGVVRRPPFWDPLPGELLFSNLTWRCLDGNGQLVLLARLQITRLTTNYRRHAIYYPYLGIARARHLKAVVVAARHRAGGRQWNLLIPRSIRNHPCKPNTQAQPLKSTATNLTLILSDVDHARCGRFQANSPHTILVVLV